MTISDRITLQDIMAELKKVATKDNIVQVKSSSVAQSAEIQQLRTEIEKHHNRIKSLEEHASVAAAEKENRTRPDVDRSWYKQYGGAHAGPSGMNTRRSSIIIHGLDDTKDDDLMEKVLDICQAIKAIIFSSDIDAITRLGNPDSKTAKSVPVRVTFQQIYMRDKIMRKKKTLFSMPKFATIFINPDEPPEIRRNKGIFRRVSAKARSDGKDVLYRGEWIKIDETTYATS